MALSDFFKRAKERIAELGKLTPIALVTTFLPIAGSSALLIIGYPAGVWLKENQAIGAFAYPLSVTAACGLALLPTNLVGVIGGFAFGFWLGLALLMAAIVAAAFISYLIHRRISGEKVQDIADKHPKAEAIYKALIDEGFWRTTAVIMLIRFSVIMPFALTNFLLAAAKVRPASFLLGTFGGMLPRSGAVVLTGAGLSELTLEASDQSWLLVFGIGATVVSVIVIFILSRKALDKMTQSGKNQVQH